MAGIKQQRSFGGRESRSESSGFLACFLVTPAGAVNGDGLERLARQLLMKKKINAIDPNVCRYRQPRRTSFVCPCRFPYARLLGIYVSIVSNPQVGRFFGCCATDSQTDENQDQMHNYLKIAKPRLSRGLRDCSRRVSATERSCVTPQYYSASRS